MQLPHQIDQFRFVAVAAENRLDAAGSADGVALGRGLGGQQRGEEQEWEGVRHGFVSGKALAAGSSRRQQCVNVNGRNNGEGNRRLAPCRSRGHQGVDGDGDAGVLVDNGELTVD